MSEQKIMALQPNGEASENKEVILPEQNIEVIIARAEKQVEIMKKVLGIAVKRLNHYDFVDQQGKPYLGASGCEKLMPLFGISLCNTTSEKKFSEDDKGKLYIYKFKGTFSWQGGSIEAIGACSSRDKFFAWDGKAQEYKALSEVDEPNILKAAYSNMLMNGVTRLLGIRNLTWEQLKGFGIDPNKVARVEYGYKTKQASPDEKKKQEEISSMCMLMTEKNREKAVAYLRELSKFTAKDKTKVPGVTSTKVLTGTRLDIVHHKTKEEYQKYLKLHNLVDEVFKEAK